MNRVYELSGRRRPRLPICHQAKHDTKRPALLIQEDGRRQETSGRVAGLGEAFNYSQEADDMGFNMSSIPEIELRNIFHAAKTGQLRSGYIDWYILREKCRDSDGSMLPNLWVNPRRMFLGTLYQAYRFVDPQGVGPVIAAMTRRDDLSGKVHEVRVDAITGLQQADTVLLPKVSLTLEEFNAALQDYYIPVDAVSPLLKRPKDALYRYLLEHGFACRPQMQENFDLAFLMFLLGSDKFVSPLLFWPESRFRLLRAALAVGTGQDLPLSEQLFVKAVQERSTMRSNGGIMESIIRQKAYFHALWSGQANIIVLTKAQRTALAALREKHVDTETMRSMLRMSTPQVSRVYNAFSILASSTNTYSYPQINTSRPAFIPPDDFRGPSDSLVRISDDSFANMMDGLAGEEGLTAVAHGLDTLGLLQAVEDLRLP